MRWLTALIVLHLFLLVPLAFAPDPDDPVTWDADYVQLNPEAAFARSMERAVQLVPDLLAQPEFAEQYFLRHPDRISAPYRDYAREYLLSGPSGNAYRAIGHTYLASSIDYGRTEESHIAARYFSQIPEEIGLLAREFERFMGAQQVEISVQGAVRGFSENGVLALQDGTTVSLHELKGLYRFAIGSDHLLRLIPKRDPQDLGTVYPSREFLIAGQIEGATEGFRLRSGSVEGYPISDSVVQLLLQPMDGHKVVYASAVTHAGPLHFAAPVPVSIDTDAEIFKTMDARITSVDAPVRLVGERIDVSGIPASQFTIPEGYSTEFISRPLPQETEEGRPAPRLPIAITGKNIDVPVLINGLPGVGSSPAVHLNARSVRASGSGYAVQVSPAALEGAKYLLRDDPADPYFRNGDLHLPIAEANKVRVIQSVVGATIDGMYGSETAEKVAQWQKDHNERYNLHPSESGYLNPQGLWGPLTTSAMLAEYEIIATPRGTMYLDSSDTLHTLYGEEVTLAIRSRGQNPVTVAALDVTRGEVRQRSAGVASPLAIRAAPRKEAVQLPNGVVFVPDHSPDSVHVDPNTGDILSDELFAMTPDMVTRTARSCSLSREGQCGAVTRLLMDRATGTRIIDGMAIHQILGYPEAGAGASALEQKLRAQGWRELSAEEPLQSFDVLLSGTAAADRDRHSSMVIGTDLSGEILVGHQWGAGHAKILSLQEWEQQIAQKRPEAYVVHNRLRAPPQNLQKVVQEIARKRSLSEVMQIARQ